MSSPARERILILLAGATNQRLLGEMLSRRYDVAYDFDIHNGHGAASGFRRGAPRIPGAGDAVKSCPAIRLKEPGT